jgi:hypothetical protein
MIPPVFPVFTGDSADFGRQIGLFCQRTCQKAGSEGVPYVAFSRHREGNAFEAQDLNQPVEMRVPVQHCESTDIRSCSGDQSIRRRHAV